MEKEFIPYEQALALKELGFDEPCIMCYYGISNFDEDKKERLYLSSGMGKVCNSHLIEKENGITAPLYQQAFKWFRKKLIIGEILMREDDIDYNYIITTFNPIDKHSDWVHYNTHEEAEFECLKKLIELAKMAKDDEGKILLEEISMCLDGGTTVYIEPHVKASITSIDEARDCQKYYVDHRIGTETDGELFDRYPDDEGAIMLDKTKYKFK